MATGAGSREKCRQELVLQQRVGADLGHFQAPACLLTPDTRVWALPATYLRKVPVRQHPSWGPHRWPDLSLPARYLPRYA